MLSTLWNVENPAVRTPPVTARTVMDRVTERWSNDHALPAITPHIGRQVDRFAFREDQTWHDTRSLVRQDPLLTALVLREANRAHGCQSLDGALEGLRSAGVRELLHRVAHGSVRMHDPDVIGWMTETQHYSWRLGRAAAAVARFTTLDVARVRTAATLADVGLLVGLSVLADGWSVRKHPRLVMELLEAGQHTLGWYLADAWALPAELQLIIGNGSSLEVQGHAHPTLAALRIARSLLFDMGLELRLPCMRGEPPHPTQLVEALDALGLGKVQLLAVRAEARRQLLG
ncbi:MAG: HDOD domain-containing protein [Proteobacteria bacterium]|nr:HDOD domain-containing protein [Pseudomonadota bacterium]MCP4915911.1 HDOD domain-containing protein [Pseudomonadota bacterium]